MTATPSYESIADVEAAAQKMRDFFLTGATLDVDYRRQALAKLKAYLKANEERILSALTADLGKAPFEGYAPEPAARTWAMPSWRRRRSTSRPWCWSWAARVPASWTKRRT